MTLRVTLQRANYRQLLDFVGLARRLGAQGVSFLAVDVANPHAFGRKPGFSSDLALRDEDLTQFGALLEALEREHASDFATGFIAESPRKLRHIHRYFAALGGQGAVPPGALQRAGVLRRDRRRRPRQSLFLHSGARRSAAGEDLVATLNSKAAIEQRAQHPCRRRAECRTCVCSIWHTPGPIAMNRTMSREPEHV